MTVLRPISEGTFLRAQRRTPYLRGRWSYLKHAARIVTELGPRTVLEIGPGPLPLVPGATTMDVDADIHRAMVTDDSRSATDGPAILHDAGETPWPFESGLFDLVIGLQCWEHFKGRQTPAFLEALRVAGPHGHVLLSFPFEWSNATRAHRGIDDARIREWTAGRHPVQRVHLTTPPERQRLILLFPGEAC